MVLECIMTIVDNSLFSRNSDVYPNRFDAQLDLISNIARLKEQDNPETSLGLMVSSGRICKILLNPDEPRKVNAFFKKCEIEGDSINFIKSIQIACLSLKHRINKNQKQKIIMFVGSPINDNETDLIKLAKTLKKNNISIDIININQPENDFVLKKFNENVNKEDNCIYHNINEMVHNFVDYLGNLGIFNIKNDFGGMNEEMDDQLALAIKMSMEAEEKRQEEIKKKEEEEQKKNDLETIKEEDEKIPVDTNPNQTTNPNPNPSPNPDQSKDKTMKTEDIIKDKEFLKDVLNELKMNDDDEEVQKLIDKNDDEDKNNK